MYNPVYKFQFMKRFAKWAGLFPFDSRCFMFTGKEQPTAWPTFYNDIAYTQDFSKKFDLKLNGVRLHKVRSDRNEVIQIYSSIGLLKTYDGEFLYPGTLVQDKTYRPLTDKKILNLELYANQCVYIDDKAVLSNAWAGELYSRYTLPKAIYSNKPPYTRPYVRWCERTGSEIIATFLLDTSLTKGTTIC